MNRKLMYLLAAVMLFSACDSPQPGPAAMHENDMPSAGETDDTASDTSEGNGNAAALELRSLQGSRLRFDGVYDHAASKDLHYFMRFFDRGNVALVAGVQKPGDPPALQELLTPNAQSGTNNVHNVPVRLDRDSIFFSTMAAKGAITYAGTYVGSDTLRFLKVSEVNGKQATVDYAFRPDLPLK